MTPRRESKLWECCGCVSRTSMCFSFFVSKTVTEVKAFVRSIPPIQLKRVNNKLSWRTIDTPSTWRVRKTTSGLGKRFVQHGPSRKKKEASFLDRRKLLLRSFTLKKPNTTVLERDLQQPWLTKSMIDWPMQGGREHNPLVNRAFFFSAFVWQLLICASCFENS